MTITYERAEKCPECGSYLNYFSAFMVHGKHCPSCGWKCEKNETTGEEKISTEKTHYC